MKIDRLLGIITVLLQNEKVTAPYLAEKFEVSRRTINRDIEDICKAGIPIVTQQGVNGGISISDGYKIDKTLFTHDELKAVLSGLLSLNSVSQDKKYSLVIEKFFGENNSILSSNNIIIDLSSHYKETLAPKISLIQKCIESHTIIEFDYFNRKGQSHITFEPYILVFKWSSWYVFGSLESASSFRLCKLNRLNNLKETGRLFEITEITDSQTDFDGFFTDEIKAVILFKNSAEYRLIEEYGIDSYTSDENGLLRFEFPFTNEYYLLQWVLSFGDCARLIEPPYMRELIKSTLENSLRQY